MCIFFFVYFDPFGCTAGNASEEDGARDSKNFCGNSPLHTYFAYTREHDPSELSSFYIFTLLLSSTSPLFLLLLLKKIYYIYTVQRGKENASAFFLWKNVVGEVHSNSNIAKIFWFHAFSLDIYSNARKNVHEKCLKYARCGTKKL